MPDESGLDLSRREFMQAGTTSLLAVNSGGFAQIDPGGQPNEEYEFQGVADLMGPAAAKPEPGSDFFNNKVYYAYRYDETDGSGVWFITQDDSEWTDISMSNPTTQVDELRVEDMTSFFNHTFSRPGAPDSKNWAFVDGDITKADSEVELASTTGLIGKQRGNYPPGSEAIPGVAFRVTGTPTAGECFAGYFADTNDDQIPDIGFGFGSDSTSDFAFLAKAGTLQKIRRSDWNGETNSVADRPFASHYPRICRFPHLFYGGGAVRWRIVDHDIVDGTPTPKLKTVHTETPESAADYGSPFDAGPPFDQPNLPPAFTSNGLSGGAIRGNASHYESGDDESENRINGEFYGGSSGVSVGQTGWTHLISWRKRDGWDMVNVKPFRVGVITESSDVQVEVQLGSEISATDADYSLPTHTDSNGTSVEVTTAGSLNTAGQRRWIGYAQSGGSGAFTASPGLIGESSLDFNLPGQDIVTLAANGVGGSATVWGYVAWEEYF